MLVTSIQTASSKCSPTVFACLEPRKDNTRQKIIQDRKSNGRKSKVKIQKAEIKWQKNQKATKKQKAKNL